MADHNIPTFGEWVSQGVTYPAIKFENKGDAITGKIYATPVPRQARDMETGKPAFWESGDPKVQMPIVIETDLQDDPEDDGIRTVYLNSWGAQRKALLELVQRNGGGLPVGSTLTVTYLGRGEVKRKGQLGEKLFELSLTR